MRSTLAYIRDHKPILILIIIFFLNNLAFTYFNGNTYCSPAGCGLHFIGTHIHDSMWHLALSNTAFHTYPPSIPIYAGAHLQSYHFLFNFLLYLLTYTGIPLITLYWKIIPLIYTALLVYVSIRYARKLQDHPLFVFFFLFFIFFGSTASFITSYYHTGNLLHLRPYNLITNNTLVLTPAIGFSIIIMLSVLNILKDPHLTKKQLLYLNLAIFTSLGFKFYGGITILSIIGIHTLITYIRKRHHLTCLTHSITYLISALLAIFIFYNPFQSVQTGSVFQLQPLATVHPLIENPNLYHLPNLVLARYILAQDLTSPKYWLIETLTMFLFLLHHFGTRLTALLYYPYAIYKKQLDQHQLTIFISTLIPIAAAMLLTQKGTWWNTLQFLYYPGILLAIPMAYLCYQLFSTKLGKIIITLTILFTLPNNIQTLTPLTDPHTIYPPEELQALNQLQQLPSGTVLSIPLPETAQIPALTGQQLYIADTHILDITGIPYQERADTMNNLEPHILRELPIDYIYLDRDYNAQLEWPIEARLSYIPQYFSIIYKNDSFTIYQRNHETP